MRERLGFHLKDIKPVADLDVKGLVNVLVQQVKLGTEPRAAFILNDNNGGDNHDML